MLPFRDKAFDIVFSNSVIEHVGDARSQQAFADEVRRVGRGYWVQTPNRWSPVEMHVMLPLIHFLPKFLQRRVVTHFTVWELLVRPSEEERKVYLKHLLHELRLLDSRSLAAFFPDGAVVSERILGVPKSLIAVRRGLEVRMRQ